MLKVGENNNSSDCYPRHIVRQRSRLLVSFISKQMFWFSRHQWQSRTLCLSSLFFCVVHRRIWRQMRPNYSWASHKRKTLQYKYVSRSIVELNTCFRSEVIQVYKAQPNCFYCNHFRQCLMLNFKFNVIIEKFFTV